MSQKVNSLGVPEKIPGLADAIYDLLEIGKKPQNDFYYQAVKINQNALLMGPFTMMFFKEMFKDLGCFRVSYK